MSYAGPASRSRTATTARSPEPPAGTGGRSPRRPPATGASREHGDTDWQQVALFGAGLAFGIAIGAGAALLTAPQTGAETRAALLAGAARARRSTARRSRTAWDDLGDEIRSATHAIRRRRARRELELEVEAEY